MDSVLRKVTYRLYPSTSEAVVLDEHLRLHCRVYNTLRDLHQQRYEASLPRLTFPAMCKELTGWRHEVPALESLNAQALQVTAKRVALAFKAFFRRVKAGETPGYPRFKAPSRFSGWGYKTYGDGWKLLQPVEYRQRGGIHYGYRTVRLSGIGEIPLRGRGRFPGTPATAEVLKKGSKWFLSVTFNVPVVVVARQGGTATAAFDWGVSKLLTLARADGGVETTENPRWLRQKLKALVDLQRIISTEEVKAKLQLGLTAETPLPAGAKLPVNTKLRRLYQQVRALHGKIARQRHDFYHKLTGELVARFGCLGAEALDTAAMVKRPGPKQDPATGQHLPNGASRKAGLNRAILDAAPAKFYGLLTTKAAEAGSWFAQCDTQQVKPTQRCHRCGTLVPKSLDERTHRCTCGCVVDRDENAARTVLRWLTEGQFWPGTGRAEHGVLRPAALETPSIATAP